MRVPESCGDYCVSIPGLHLNQPLGVRAVALYHLAVDVCALGVLSYNVVPQA